MPFAQAFRRNHIRLLALLPLLQFVNIPALIAIEACQQVYDYLQTNPNVSESDRLICEI
ncbi:hypothetical protein [Okeania sp. SIO2C2]|uniref:hypothetical protein n=1 Tax=Okeania sp. SIO2C2 TaxID=2607787 RepID=UPI00257F5937|nr:hypothetical protein [Okeania sp. SIO2C2]